MIGSSLHAVPADADAPPRVVVVGGSNMDLKAHSSGPVVPGTSNPGVSTLSPGGVGRNIAENLGRLGTAVHLVSAVGDDPIGADLIEATAAAGVDVSLVRRRDVATGTYAAVLDHDGELVVAISDMNAVDEVTPLVVRAARDVLAGAALLVVESNVPADTVAQVLQEGHDLGVPVVLDPVSVPKAKRIADLLAPERPVRLLTPNRDELAGLTGSPVESDEQLLGAVRQLHDRGVELVWVRLGARGSLLSGPEGVVECTSLPTVVADVTGAGDALLAAFCHAWLRGADPVEAARYGHAAAAVTISGTYTVSPHLTDDLVRSLL